MGSWMEGARICGMPPVCSSLCWGLLVCRREVNAVPVPNTLVANGDCVVGGSTNALILSHVLATQRCTLSNQLAPSGTFTFFYNLFYVTSTCMGDGVGHWGGWGLLRL